MHHVVFSAPMGSKTVFSHTLNMFSYICMDFPIGLEMTRRMSKQLKKCNMQEYLLYSDAFRFRSQFSLPSRFSTNRIWLSLSTSVLKGKHQPSTLNCLALRASTPISPVYACALLCKLMSLGVCIFIMTDKGRPPEASLFLLAIAVSPSFPRHWNPTAV